MSLADDLDSRAHDCRAEANRLDRVAQHLEERVRQLAADWSGTAADSFRAEMDHQHRRIEVARDNLREAARIMRAYAKEIRLRSRPGHRTP